MGEKGDEIQQLIDRILSSDRMKASAHFSHGVYGDEPILTTGRRMTGYLPERYREMRAISRWQDGSSTGHGRWLSEAELFYRQGAFMADWEDDCPYHGSFKSYYPTYNAMSDRQLRGYFTWRAAVRRGEVEETSVSFAYVYLYELVCGIGVADAEEGLARMREFLAAYREFAPALERYARTWMLDYVAYHGLDASLLGEVPAIEHDRLVGSLMGTCREALSQLPDRLPKGLPVLAGDVEERLFRALDGLSSYRIANGRYAREHPVEARHVACAVFLRLCGHYAKHRKLGLVETLFGQMMELPYTMFASAVFWAPEPHADAEVEIDPLRRYRCERGMWTCTRLHGETGRSAKLGEILREVDRRMREASGYPHALKAPEEGKIPRYRAKIIDEEVTAGAAAVSAVEARRVDIDLTKLAGIRSAAADTREALLIDEEREGGTDAGEAGHEASALVDAAEELAAGPSGGEASDAPSGGGMLPTAAPAPAEHTPSVQPVPATDSAKSAIKSPDAPIVPSFTPKPPATDTVPIDSPAAPIWRAEPAATAPNGLSPAQAAYLRALLAGDDAARVAAVAQAGTSEDLLVDAVNETLFDEVGDTVVEFGQNGPEIIEDYRPDVEGLLPNDQR